MTLQRKRTDSQRQWRLHGGGRKGGKYTLEIFRWAELFYGGLVSNDTWESISWAFRGCAGCHKRHARTTQIFKCVFSKWGLRVRNPDSVGFYLTWLI
eukprot:2477775-Ditylum_brightwellii.AAC.1